MDKPHYDEMVSSLNELERENAIQGKRIYLFGYCNATEELAKLLISRGYAPIAILDNNKNKHGNCYRNIPVVPPEDILAEDDTQTVVCIVARAYAAMADQLKRLGYQGQIRKLVDYNSYADYSLSAETVARMRARAARGMDRLAALVGKHPGYFKILCPFSALGDIYIMMSYLPYFLKKRGADKCVICTVGEACGQVAELYCNEDGSTENEAGTFRYEVECFSQKEMDELIQAVIYTQDAEAFIPHQDRPYVVNLHRALYAKKLSLEQIYCCGVFGLSGETEPVSPVSFANYPYLAGIPKGKAVILSPCAKSVTALPETVWKEIISHYTEMGYSCFTNVTGEEKALAGTLPICPKLNEVKSVVEQAGTFIGIRSGLCDVLRDAEAEKTALYPDYNYCDTRWKAIDIYTLDGWDNRVVREDFVWRTD